MTSKEKALELVKYFFSRIIRDKKKIIAIPLADAKEYALRIVDEMLNENGMIYHTEGTKNYWEEVKKEIGYL